MEKGKSLGIISLIVAIAALIIGIFSLVMKKDNKNTAIPPMMMSDSTVATVRVGYVNFDTVMNKCLIVDDLLANIERRTNQMDADLEAQRKEFEKDANYLQQQIQSGSISQESAQEVYANLMNKEQDLYALQERYAQEIQALNIQSNAEVYAQVITFLQRYNKDYKYFDYILNYSMTNPALLDANNYYDITTIVVDSLNRLYNNAAKLDNKDKKDNKAKSKK